MITICKSKGAHGHSLWDINSGSSNSSSMARREEPRVGGVESLAYAILDD